MQAIMRPSSTGNVIFDQIADDCDLYGPPIFVSPALYADADSYRHGNDRNRSGVFAVFDKVVVFKGDYYQLVLAKKHTICNVSTRRLFGRKIIELKFSFQQNDGSWHTVQFSMDKSFEEEVCAALPTASKEAFIQKRSLLLQSAMEKGNSAEGIFWQSDSEYVGAKIWLDNLAFNLLTMQLQSGEMDLKLENLYGIRGIANPEFIGPLGDARIGSLPSGMFEDFDLWDKSIWQLFFEQDEKHSVVYLISPRSDESVQAVIDFLLLRDGVNEIYPIPHLPDAQECDDHATHIANALQFGYATGLSMLNSYAPSGDKSGVVSWARSVDLGAGYRPNSTTFHTALIVLTNTHFWTIPHTRYQIGVDLNADSHALMRSTKIEDIVDCIWSVSPAGWQVLRILSQSLSRSDELNISIHQFWGDPQGSDLAREVITRVRANQKLVGHDATRFEAKSDESKLFENT